MMPPLITVLAAGRSARPTVGKRVGPRTSAATPMATPVTALPLKTSSIKAILASITPLPMAPPISSRRANTQDGFPRRYCHIFLRYHCVATAPSGHEQDLADVAARFHQPVSLRRIDEWKPLVGEHAQFAGRPERPDLLLQCGDDRRLLFDIARAQGRAGDGQMLALDQPEIGLDLAALH